MKPQTREALVVVHSALSSWQLSLVLIVLQVGSAIYVMRLDSYFRLGSIPITALAAVDIYRFIVRFLR